MDLTQLEYFKAVARLENVTKAAKELYISQPTLSQSIARLEESLGVELFDRKGGKIRLNDAGRLFLHRVDNAFAELNTGYAELENFKQGRQDWVRITSSVIDIFKSITPEFMRRSPGVHVDHILTFDNGIMELLMNGKVDFAITPNPIDDPKILCVPLYEEEVFAVVGDCHPLASRTEVTLEELKGMPLMCNNCDADVHFMEKLFGVDRKELNIIASSSEPAVLRELTEAGWGIGFLPARVAARHLANPKSKQKPLRVTPMYRRTTCISTKIGHQLSPSAQKFYQFVLEFCAKDVARVDAFLADYYGH